MASFNGQNLGFIFSMPVAPNPKGRQINAYAGANGLEVIDHGTRGGRTFVDGAFIAPSASSLASVEGQMRTLQQDGGAYILVDTLGTSWAGVILEEWTPKGPVRPVAGGYYARRYEASFLHVY